MDLTFEEICNQFFKRALEIKPVKVKKEKKKAEVWTKKDIKKVEVGRFKVNINAEKLIFNDKATILFYTTNLDYEPITRKVISKCQEGDKYSKEDGFRICMLKAMKRELERELKQY